MSYKLRSRQNNMATSNNDNNQQQHQAAIQDALQRLEQNLQQLSLKPNVTVNQLPPTFSAKPGEEAAQFIDQCVAWCDINGQQDAAGLLHVLQLVLKGPALSWLEDLPIGVKGNRQQIVTEFKDRFIDNNTKWVQEQQLLALQMMPNDKIDDYIFAIDSLCSKLKKNDNDRVACFVRGLAAPIKAFVIQQQPTTWKEATQAARLAALSQAAVESSSASGTSGHKLSALSSYCAQQFTSPSLQVPAQQPTYPYPFHPSPYPLASSSLSSAPSYDVLSSQYGASFNPEALARYQHNAAAAMTDRGSSSLGMASMPSLNLSSMRDGVVQHTSPYAPMYTAHNTIAPSPQHADTTMATLISTVDELARSVKQLQQQPQSAVAGIATSAHSSHDADRRFDVRSHVICQICGKPNHDARTCYQLRDNRNTSRKNYQNNHNNSSITCYNCNKKGHRASQCYSSNNTNAHYSLNK
jgi:uncharacterized protein YoxC